MTNASTLNVQFNSTKVLKSSNQSTFNSILKPSLSFSNIIEIMKTKLSRWHRLIIYTICVNLMMFASIQLCKGSSNEEGNERTLSRRRRHLIFPEGSSLQIVYDIYHPVVDYTNLLVVGITGAFAWELPSEPVHPDEELEELYKNSSLPLLRRNDDDEVEINNIRNEIITAQLSTYNGSDKFRNYLSSNKPIKETNERTEMTNFYNQFSNSKIHSRKNLFPRNEIRHGNNSHHSFRPIFRKRSTSDNTIAMSSEDIFHWKLHKTSRYKLYKHLEKFIDTTGNDGRDCILKALCETGQLKRNIKRRSFLGEIMRAILSLPDIEVIQENLSDDWYAAAYTERRNCTTRYPKCSQNVWKSSFH